MSATLTTFAVFAPLPALVLAGVRWIAVVLIGALRHLQKAYSILQFFPRGGQVLEKLHFLVKMNDKGLVFVDAENWSRKLLAASRSSLSTRRWLRLVINQHTEAQGKIGFVGEVADVLRTVIFLQFEVIAVEVVNNGALLIMHCGEHIHHFDVGGDGRPLSFLRANEFWLRIG